MQLFQMNEARFFIPGDFSDQTVNMFLAPKGQSADFSLVVTREEVKPGQTLEGYVSEQAGKMTETFTAYRQLHRGDTTLGNQPAHEVEFLWEADGRPMHQHQTFVFARGMALTFTATAPENVYFKYEDTVKRLLATVQVFS